MGFSDHVYLSEVQGHILAKTPSGQNFDFDISSGRSTTHHFELGATPIQVLGNGDYLVSEPSSNKVDRVNSTGKTLWTVPLGEAGTLSAISQDEHYALLGEGSAGRIEIVDLKGGAIVKAIPGESLAATAVAISPDGRFGVEADQGGAIVLFALSPKDSWVRRFSGHSAKVTSLSFSANSKRLLTSSLDGSVRLWDTSSGEEMLRIQGTSPLNAAAFNSSASKILALDTEGRIHVYNGESVSVASAK